MFLSPIVGTKKAPHPDVQSVLCPRADTGSGHESYKEIVHAVGIAIFFYQSVLELYESHDDDLDLIIGGFKFVAEHNGHLLPYFQDQSKLKKSNPQLCEIGLRSLNVLNFFTGNYNTGIRNPKGLFGPLDQPFGLPFSGGHQGYISTITLYPALGIFLGISNSG